MKKLLLLYLFLAFMVIAFSACTHDSTEKNDAVAEVKYGTIEACYLPYYNAQELVDDADIVLIGKVTGISFQVADRKTEEPPAKDAKKKYDAEYGRAVESWRVFDLITLYDVDVITTYKGKAVKSAQIRMRGGLQDYHVEEQLSVLAEYDMEEIFVSRDRPEIKIGEAYLFVLAQSKTGVPWNMIPEQSIYNLHDPFEKHTLGNYELDDPAKYYSKNKDQYGRPIMSAKDVISVFGEDKWGDFWTQWQRDDPDWETRIDKDVVEKVLAEK